MNHLSPSGGRHPPPGLPDGGGLERTQVELSPLQEGGEPAREAHSLPLSSASRATNS